jgi:uncharacterized protein (DUF169 family)
MDTVLKEKFIVLWKKYFKNAELPITFYYTNTDVRDAKLATKSKTRSCLICELRKVRNGESIQYNVDTVTCSGGKRYLGFTDKVRTGFEYFLSCGSEDIEGERYKRTPDMVLEMMKDHKPLPITGKNIVFKRWDNLTEADNPEVVIFFSTPDVLAGLFTLANFDQTEPNGTFTPFGAGCGSIVYYPYLEIKLQRPRAVIGMFDPSARPCVQNNVLSFAAPMIKFEKMINYMEESFLITGTWKTVMKRI